MRTFEYVIKDELGIHARPAGQLAKEARQLESTVTIECRGKSAAATKLMAVMGMGVKYGDTVRITIEGGDEEATEKMMKSFFEGYL